MEDKMKRILLLIAIIVTASVTVKYAQPVNALIEQVKKHLYHADVVFEIDSYMKAHGLLERALVSEEDNYFANYFLAYTDYKIAVYFRQKEDTDQFQKYIDSSEKILKGLIKENDHDVEALSLLGTLYGIQVSVNSELGPTLGQQNVALTSKALSLAPDNPRVLLQKGLSKLNTPEFYGGSKTDALKYFKQSVELFETTGQNDNDINWGYLDAMAWLGITQTKLKDFQSAIKTFNKALEVEPDFAWIKYELLPKAEEKLTSYN